MDLTWAVEIEHRCVGRLLFPALAQQANIGLVRAWLHICMFDLFDFIVLGKEICNCSHICCNGTTMPVVFVRYKYTVLCQSVL